MLLKYSLKRWGHHRLGCAYIIPNAVHFHFIPAVQCSYEVLLMTIFRNLNLFVQHCNSSQCGGSSPSRLQRPEFYTMI